LEYKGLGITRQDVDEAFARLDKLLDDAKSKGPVTATGASGSPAELQAVRDLYARFREAYEARDDSRIMSFMGDDWEAGDGTTLSDMQANLSRMFRKFDEIKMDIQNMQINPAPQGFMVTYDVTISSRIYKKNLRHQEKSAVSEQVAFIDKGKPRIVRTLNGRYWLVE
jgi:murein L,D-transpeptidase YafK